MNDDITTQSPTFSNIGIENFEIGTYLFKALNVGAYELSDPQNAHKLAEISNFLENDLDPNFTISSVIRSNKSPNIKNIDHLYGYVKLKQSKMELQTKIEELDNQLKYYE